MIEPLSAWWRARTARERMLLQGAAVLIFVIVLPLWAFQAAAKFRADAAAELAAARQVEAGVARLAAGAAAPAPGGDATLRGRALAAAEASGLTVYSVTPAGPDRLQVTFAPASPLAVYAWLRSMAASGAAVTSTTIRRTGQGDEVASVFEIAGQ